MEKIIEQMIQTSNIQSDSIHHLTVMIDLLDKENQQLKNKIMRMENFLIKLGMDI